MKSKNLGLIVLVFLILALTGYFFWGRANTAAPTQPDVSGSKTGSRRESTDPAKANQTAAQGTERLDSTIEVEELISTVNKSENAQAGMVIPDYEVENRLTKDPELRKNVFAYMQTYILSHEAPPKETGMSVLLYQMQMSFPKEAEEFCIQTIEKLEVEFGDRVDGRQYYKALVYFLGENAFDQDRVVSFLSEIKGSPRELRGLATFLKQSSTKTPESLKRAKELLDEGLEITSDSALKADVKELMQ